MNKEIEERLTKSFEYNDMNMTLLKFLYGLPDPIPTIFDMAMLWDRAKTTADRKVLSPDKWFEDEKKIEVFIDYYQSNIKRFLLGIAGRERSEAMTSDISIKENDLTRDEK